MKTVLSSGCYDLFHYGHLEHLQEAREMGDRLVVALTFDDHVNKGPGRPINKWADRAFILRGLRCVDEVIGAASSTSAIRALKPTYFVKGIDYANGDMWTEDIVKVCEEVGTIIRFTKSPKQSAQEIIRKALA